MSKRKIAANEEDRKRAKYDEYIQYVESPSNSIKKDIPAINKKFDQYKCFIGEVSTSNLDDLSKTENFDNDIDMREEVAPSQPSDLSKDLAHYVTCTRRMTKQTNLLLKVLHKNNIRNIPKSYEKLMSTPKEKVVTKNKAGGRVFHYGIERALKSRENELRDLKEINLDIGVDGTGIFNSSSLKIWPYMAAIVDNISMRPFLLGSFEGKKDPKDNSFLDDLCDEVEYLRQNEIKFSYGTRKVNIRLFCADAPARALICAVKGHTCHDGCPFCIMKYRIWDGKVVFGSEIGPTLRTDASFSLRLQPEHHRDEFRYQHSRLEKLFKMVSQFPPEPMHAIEKGVVTDKLEFIKRGDNASEISAKMENFKFYRPSEFARDCRSLDNLSYFKATELRQFLYYGCVAILKDLVDDHIYYMWLLLHCAVRLLSMGSEHVDEADVLLKEYVNLYPTVYGENSVTYCVHMLLHIPYFVRLYGTLDSFSAYKFENFIQRLKKFVGNAHNPLQQIFNRIEERNLNFGESDEIADFNKVELGFDEKDSFFAVKNNNKIFPVKVVNIVTENEVQCIKVLRCLNLKSLFTHPMDSAQLGELSYETLSTNEETFPLSTICWKYCRIPYKDEFALLPILHTLFHKFQN